jgi:hypothetical protein
VAKGAATSRDLVRSGIENVLKEVLGALATGFWAWSDHWEKEGEL